MIDQHFWPSDGAFLDLSDVRQITDGRARCIGVAVCDAEGQPTNIFYQGQPAHFFYEFELLHEIGVPSGGLEFHDATDQVIHGKNTLQYGTPPLDVVHPGMRLRYHQVINMEVGFGEYWFSVGLASTDKSSFLGYQQGPVTHYELMPRVHKHCRVVDAGSFSVTTASTGKLLHHGMANLSGRCHVMAAEALPPESAPGVETRVEDEAIPTIVHVTHWKAGSQWIYKILRECAPERIVEPRLRETQFLRGALQPGKVYPTAYVTKKQFDSVPLPRNWSRFVVIRDLRDTLVSAYFSIKLSHQIVDPRLAHWRSVLQALSPDDGMIYLMDEWVLNSARIQISWVEAGEPLIRYEDLLGHDLDILERVLLDECQLPVSRERLREVILSSRFERLTKGRKRGQEDIMAHARKGIAGDWRNYFSNRVKQSFKTRYGGLLVATGYEQDLSW
jgi:lipopolysaccharide transport system ATP-binding protein